MVQYRHVTSIECQQKIATVVKAAQSHAIAPGWGVGWADNQEVHVEYAGNWRYHTDAPAITEESIFDVASITKVLPTSLLALQALSQGRCTLNDQLIRFLPEYQGNFREQVRLQHLLTPSLHLQPIDSSQTFSLAQLWTESVETLRQHILTAPLSEPPGTRLAYTNSASILLGWALERIWGKPLVQLAQENIFLPLELTDTCFNPNERDTAYKNRVVPTELDPRRGGELRGEVHDESAWKLTREPGSAVGSAGVFSSVRDLLKLGQCWLDPDRTHKLLNIDPTTWEISFQNHAPESGTSYGLGWELGDHSWMGELCSDQCLGKTGFTGCSLLVDRTRGKTVVILSNAAHPQRPLDREPLQRIRREIHDTVLSG